MLEQDSQDIMENKMDVTISYGAFRLVRHATSRQEIEIQMLKAMIVSNSMQEGLTTHFRGSLKASWKKNFLS